MKKIVTVFFPFIFLYGCSSSYSEVNLRKLTSRATGLSDYSFIIGNRENNTFSIKYDIKTKDTGAIYHCNISFFPLIPRSGGAYESPACADSNGMLLHPVQEAPIKF